MTPEEIVDKWLAEHEIRVTGYAKGDLDRMIGEAIAEEREACAKVADEAQTSNVGIAELIRARGYSKPSTINDDASGA